MRKGHILLIAALSASLALTGCDSGKEDDKAASKTPPQQTASDAQQPDASDTSEQTAPSQPRRLEGEVVFSATDTPVPDDAELTISLRGVARSDAPSVTIAETSLTPGNEDPVRFRLDYDTGDITPGTSYALRGEVRNASGELLWVSAKRHGVEVGNAADQGPVTLTLEPVRAADTSGSMQDTQKSMLSPPPGDSVQHDASLEGQADNVQEPSAAEAQPPADAPAERSD
ncbi:MAG TPA: YbaY family lipoprotein [Halomonas sp.]|nr:YbaY family lipoprotein [Halomonas sp.]